MKRAILICGYEDCGKTSILRYLVTGSTTQQFKLNKNKSRKLRIGNTEREFIIQQLSNDDPGLEKYLDDISKRWIELGGIVDDLIAAFCPNYNDPDNDGVVILSNRIFNNFDEIHLMLLLNKWQDKDILDVERIKQHFRNIGKLHYHEIQSHNDDRKEDVKAILERIYS